jgi:Glycosyl hydrolases family 38 C-terminal domain
MLEGGRQIAYESLASSAAAITGYTARPFLTCPLNNVTLCDSLEAGLPTAVLLYNNLGQASTNAPIHLSLGFPSGVNSWTVYDSTGTPITAQLVPLSERDSELRQLYGGDNTTTIQWIYFVANIPAAGFSTYFLVPSVTEVPSTFQSVVQKNIVASSDYTVTNNRLSFVVSSATGFMSSYTDSQTGVNIPLTQSWSYYLGFNGSYSLNGSKQSSGAYIFRPALQTTNPISTNAAIVSLITGPIVNFTLHQYNYVTQETRLWLNSAHIDIEYTVGPINVTDSGDPEGHEVVVRYTSGLTTNGQFSTDSNCREQMNRVRNSRGNWSVALSEPVAGNCMLHFNTLYLSFYLY